MATLLSVMYAFYFILVGIEGNASAFLSMIGQEKQYLYWFVVLLVVLALWESPVAEPLAKSLAVLIVLGWLLTKGNGQKVGQGLKQILPAL